MIKQLLKEYYQFDKAFIDWYGNIDFDFPISNHLLAKKLYKKCFNIIKNAGYSDKICNDYIFEFCTDQVDHDHFEELDELKKYIGTWSMFIQIIIHGRIILPIIMKSIRNCKIV